MLANIRKNARRRDLVIVFFAAITIAAVSAALFSSRRTTTVHLLNPLDVPVFVSIGGPSVLVPAKDRSQVRVSSGIHLAVAKTGDGRAVDSAVVDADPSASAVVYNVLGGAPLIALTIRYTAAASSDHDPEVTTFAGQRVVSLRNIDYVFTEPPHSISTKSHGDITKRALMLVPERDVNSSLGYLLVNGKKREAVVISEAIARLRPDSRVYLAPLEQVMRDAYGDGSALPVLLPLLKSGKPSDDLMGLIRAESCRAGACEEASRLVAPFLVADPVKRELLVARDLPRGPQLAKVDELTKAHPENLDVVARRAWLALADERWADCVALFEKAKGRPDAAYDVDDRAICLLAQGKSAEALALATEVARRTDDAAVFGEWVLRRVAHATNQVSNIPPRPSTTKASETDELAYALRSGTVTETTPYPKDNKTVAQVRDLALDAAKGVSTRRWSEATAQSFHELSDPLLIVVGAEMAVRGEIDLARRILGATNRTQLSPEEMIEYVLTGMEPATLFRADLEERAALDLGRGRRLSQLGRHQDASTCFANVRRRDWFKGWATRLMTVWKDAPLATAPVRVYTAQR